MDRTFSMRFPQFTATPWLASVSPSPAKVRGLIPFLRDHAGQRYEEDNIVVSDPDPMLPRTADARQRQSPGGAGRFEEHSVLRHGLYNVGGQAVRGVVSALTIPFLIRLLGIREYGVWTLAYAVLGLMTTTELGLSVAGTVFLSKDLARADSSEASKTLTFISLSGVALAVAIGLLLWFAGPEIVQLLAAFGASDRSTAGRALQIAGLGVSALILERTLVGVEQAFDRYPLINILGFLESLLVSVGLVVVAWLGGRTIAMMKWQVVASTTLVGTHCYVVYRLLRGKRLSFIWGGKKAQQILRFSVATWTGALGSTVFSDCDRMLVGAVLGAPLLGIYSAITTMTSKINSLSGKAVQPLLSSLSRDAELLAPVERRIRQATHFNALIAIEAGIFLFLLADGVMRFMVPGAAAPQDILGLQIAAIIYALYSISAPGYYILFSVGEARTNAVVTLSSAVVSLGLILVGARHFGLLGAIAGNTGYVGTLFMTALGMKTAGISLRRYLSWIAFPILGLAVTLSVGLVLEDHFWWRASFLVIQACLFMFWFSREQGGLASLRLGWGRITQE